MAAGEAMMRAGADPVAPERAAAAPPPPPAPRREPWSQDFGHLEQFSRFPKDRSADAQPSAKDSILFQLAEDSRESRDRAAGGGDAPPREAPASTSAAAPPLSPDVRMAMRAAGREAGMSPSVSPDVKQAMRAAGREAGMTPPLSPDVRDAMRTAGRDAGMAYTTVNPILAPSPGAGRAGGERAGGGEERPAAMGTLHSWMSEHILPRK